MNNQKFHNDSSEYSIKKELRDANIDKDSEETTYEETPRARIERNKFGALIDQAKEKITPFVIKWIEDGHHFFGSHGHLGYNDSKFWGHYISPVPHGVLVTVYLQDEIKGNPLDVDGERGGSFSIEIPLSKDLIKKFIQNNEASSNDDIQEEIKEAVDILRNGYHKTILDSINGTDQSFFHGTIEEYKYPKRFR